MFNLKTFSMKKVILGAVFCLSVFGTSAQQQEVTTTIATSCGTSHDVTGNFSDEQLIEMAYYMDKWDCGHGNWY